MAKNKISEFSSTPANNTDIGGIDIAEGCAPSGINNAIRELMAQLKDQQVGTDADNFTVGGNLSVTGTSTFAAGSVSAPSLSPSGDTNTGIFFPAADTIAFAEGGVESMRIDASSNVGIGITPKNTYSLAKTLEMGTTTGAYAGALYTSNGSNLVLLQNSYLNNSAENIYANTGAASSYIQNAGQHIWNKASSGTAGATFSFTQAMALDASGNLSVAGTIGTSGTIKSAANGGGSVQVQNFTSTAGQAAGFKTLVQSSNWGAAGTDFITTLVNATTGSTDTEIKPFSESSGTQTTALKIRSSTNIVTMPAYGAGTATFSASGVISSVSDENYKIKDGEIADPIPMLMALETGYYYFRDMSIDTPTPVSDNGRQLGFYAQNVHNAIGEEAAPTPETYTTKDKDGNEVTKTKPWVYYDRSVLAVVVEALKKQQTMINELSAKVAALEAK
jgi:hypothetical protein